MTETKQETGKLMIKCMDDENYKIFPHCPHGPALLFYHYNPACPTDYSNGYFACSAFRDGQCNNFLNITSQNIKTAWIMKYSLNHDDFKSSLKQLRYSPAKNRGFCHTCNKPFTSQSKKCHVNHSILKEITDEMLLDPTTFLRPLSIDTAQAQYFFDEKTLQFLGKCLKDLKINKVICIGAPRLHFFLKSKCDHINKSILLDLDHRFFYFCDKKEYAWFNMCNNHFLEGDSKKQIFEDFLKVEKSDNILLFTDPPFGCRTEPIINTLKSISQTYRTVNSFNQILPIFWVFPYFAEHYIQKFMPEMEMCEYKVLYTNHQLYKEQTKKKKNVPPSPIRVFTNIPLSLIRLSRKEGYIFCKVCKRWTINENQHCNICGICPSKNGYRYRHCEQCAICVKPSYKHCDSCRRCTQTENHNCIEYQKTLRCWICTKVGHTEWNCKVWQQYSNKLNLHPMKNKNKVAVCLICSKLKHNEKNCPKRKKCLEEIKFMSKTDNIFTKYSYNEFNNVGDIE